LRQDYGSLSRKETLETSAQTKHGRLLHAESLGYPPSNGSFVETAEMQMLRCTLNAHYEKFVKEKLVFLRRFGDQESMLEYFLSRP